MRILSIGTDRRVFGEVSAARKRLEAYARHFDVIDHIVFTKASDEERSVQRGNLFLLATRSHTKWRFGLDAYSLGLGIPRPDVVTVQDPFETGLIGFLIARRWRAPLHVQLHTDPFAPGFTEGSLKNRIRRMIARFVLRRATRIRVVSHRIAESLRVHGFMAPISVLPIFVDISRFARAPRHVYDAAHINMLFVGRLEREKRPELALEALVAARGVGHQTFLTIVGGGRMSALLERMAAERGIEKYVQFVEWQDDIVPYLSDADVVLVPSRFEGYGLTIIEALAAGVPVISTDVGIAREQGVVIASEREYGAAVIEWIERGERIGRLEHYPYTDFDDYVTQWCNDIAACASDF